jgi:hypothetical protein
MNVLQFIVEDMVGYPVDWASTASWVQAAGAIVALGVAIELPRRARSAERDVIRRTVITYCTAIRDGVRAIAILDGTLQEVTDKTAITTVSMEVNLPSLLEALEHLPLFQLGNDKAVDATIRLGGAARAFLADCRAADGNSCEWKDSSPACC